MIVHILMLCLLGYYIGAIFWIVYWLVIGQWKMSLITCIPGGMILLLILMGLGHEWMFVKD